MTLADLKAKAELHDAKLICLSSHCILKEGDYVEWSKDAFTPIVEGSSLIGKSIHTHYPQCQSAYRLVP